MCHRQEAEAEKDTCVKLSLSLIQTLRLHLSPSLLVLDHLFLPSGPFVIWFFVLWSFGVFILRSSALCSSGPLFFWSYGLFILWHSGSLVFSSFGPLSFWSSGLYILWSSVLRSSVLCSFGLLLLWSSGLLLFWSFRLFILCSSGSLVFSFFGPLSSGPSPCC